MLYISSRNKTDSFTANRTICSNTAPDGGLYIPYQIPLVDAEALKQMRKNSFCENMSYILNLFFSGKLTAWDVECCIGRTPVRMAEMSHRIITAECFHNPQNAYSYLVNAVFTRLSQSKVPATDWGRIAIRIAVLFSIYAVMPLADSHSFDIAVVTGDFSDPMAVWYARKMGIPVRKIICCCNENSAPWDLLQRGEFNTGMPLVDTGMKDLDYSCPPQIERLIYHTLGLEKTAEFNNICHRKGVYRLEEEDYLAVSDGFAASVVGKDRMAATVRSVYRTNGYFISPVSAVLYGGLQDYRSRSGESRYTLILADSSPMLHIDEVAQACGISQSALTKAFVSHKE